MLIKTPGRHAVATLFTALAMLLGHAAVAAAEAEDPAPAEPPHWPYGIDLPEELKPEPSGKKRKPQAPILAWVPEGAEQVRGVLLIPANSDSKHFGEHKPLREVLAKHEVAVVYLRAHPLESNRGDAQLILDTVAEATGIEEFSHAPWITFGKSSRGKFPYYLAWAYPDRVIATISYHAETPTLPLAEWAAEDAADATILHVSANGETEWGGTYFKHVRPSLLNYRAQTDWLPHQVVADGVGHGDYVDVHGGKGYGKPTGEDVSVKAVWDYLSVFVDKALTLRLPDEGYPTTGPLTLRPVDPSGGLLVEPYAVEDIFRKPRQPLVQGDDGGYVVDPTPEVNTNGYAKVAPAEGYTPGEGVPVVDFEPGQSPTDWLLVKGLNFALDTDPMEDVSAYTDLRPEPGDTVRVEKQEGTFTPIQPKEIGRREKTEAGISIKNLGLKGRQLSLVAYTVLKVEEPVSVKVAAGHSLAVRVQLILSGQPVDHRQVLELQPGLYPLMMVARMDGALWGELEPHFIAASPEDVAEAKQTQATKERLEAELEARLAEGRKPASYIHKWDDVPEGERVRMMWIADEEQAAAWIKLHDPATREGGE